MRFRFPYPEQRGGKIRKPFQVRLKGVPAEFQPHFDSAPDNLGIRGANEGTYGLGGNTHGGNPNSTLHYYHNRPPTKDSNFSRYAFNQRYYLSRVFKKSIGVGKITPTISPFFLGGRGGLFFLPDPSFFLFTRLVVYVYHILSYFFFQIIKTFKTLSIKH